MRVGISIGTTFRGGDHRDGPRSVLAQAAAAAGAGLDTLSVGDHHSTGPSSYLQNVPVIGRILAEWTDERPVGCLFLVPLWHPVLMAEQIGTLAAMAAGPFIVQAGAGGGTSQFEAMGVPLGQRGARLDEGIRVARALLGGETVDSDLYALKGACIAPLPPSGTEWWIGGGVVEAIDRAARLGDCWYANADLTPAAARRLMDVYREACSRYRREPVRVPIRKDVFLAEDRAEAEALGDGLVERGYRGFERQAVAYGDPQSVAEQLSVYAEIGFTDVIIRIMTGGEAAVRAVELAGELRRLLA